MPRGDGRLDGRRILITRPAKRGEGLASRLRAAGVEVDLRPTIALTGPSDPAPAVRAVRELAAYDWIVFSSPSGVEFFFRRLRAERATLPPKVRVAAVGQGTARELARAGASAAVVARDSRAEGLAAELGPRLRAGQTVLWIRPEVARPVLAQELRAAGVEVDEAAFYRNVAAAGTADVARDLARGRYDLVVFTSPSTWRRLADAAAGLGLDLRRALASVAVAAIGEVTAAALREGGIDVGAVAAEPTDAALEATVLTLLAS